MGFSKKKKMGVMAAKQNMTFCQMLAHQMEWGCQ
jgi:hypothetical protein